jgi:hypothetical protein
MTRFNIAAALFAAFGVLCAGCGTVPQNTNNPAANSNPVAQASANKTPPPVDPCSGSISDKQTAVTTYLNNEIAANQKLSAQQSAGAFDFRVRNPPATSYLTLYIGGLMAVNHGTANSLLVQLNRIVDPIMKEGCVMKIDLVSLQGLPPVPPAPMPAAPSLTNGFEWTACDWPANPCPDGTCSQSCPTVNPSPSPSPAGSPGGNTSNSGNKNGG